MDSFNIFVNKTDIFIAVCVCIINSSLSIWVFWNTCWMHFCCTMLPSEIYAVIVCLSICLVVCHKSEFYKDG